MKAMTPMTAKRPIRTSRRGVLTMLAAGAGGAILAACGQDSSPPPTVAATPAPTVAPRPTVAATVAMGATAATVATAPTATVASVASVAPTTAASSPAAATRASTSTGTGTTAPVPAATTGVGSPAAAATSGKYPSPADGVPDAYDTLPPPFKAVAMVPGKGSKVTILHQYYNGAPPVPRDQNKYWQELEKRLGVTYEPTFVPGGSYDEKFAAVAAGGDFPDLVFLGNTPAQLGTIQQGAFTDLTSYLTGDGLKEFPNIATISPKLFKNLAVKGKVYGVPGSRSTVGNPLIFRRDWAETLSIPTPKNADDFFNTMVAFTKNDPDGNGKADTYGLSSGNQLGILCAPYFAQMFRAPNGWRLNADGTLTHQIETDEFKQAITFMNRLWAAGVYHPDAPTMSGSPLKDNFAGSKYGAYSDALTALQDGIAQQTLQVNPKAKVTAIGPPGFDGGKAVTFNSPGWGYYLAIPSKVGKDKERVKELLRVVDYFCAPFGSDEWRFVNYGIENVDYTTQPDGSIVRTQQGDREIGDFKRTANGPQSYYVPAVPGIAHEMQTIAQQMIAVGIDNPTLGQFSPTNAMKGSVLDQLFVDRVIAITTGREPLSAIDAWVKDWRSRGGDQIRKEYEQALKGQ